MSPAIALDTSNALSTTDPWPGISCPTTPLHLSGYRLSRCLRVSVLPEPQNHPTGLLKLFVGIAIPDLIRSELLLPEGAVGLWHGAVLRATVPKTTVNEHRHLETREDDVRTAATSRQHGSIDPKSQPTPV
ncbi:MAG TPA: hypothetical protein VF081_10375 [Solirubrobacterales bacterium]